MTRIDVPAGFVAENEKFSTEKIRSKWKFYNDNEIRRRHLDILIGHYNVNEHRYKIPDNLVNMKRTKHRRRTALKKDVHLLVEFCFRSFTFR